jgi:hypothetical protein
MGLLLLRALPPAANVRSMWKTIYHGSFWTMQKI